MRELWPNYCLSFGGANRVKEGFQHRKHLGLIIYQYEIYLREKSGHSRMKKEEGVAKILLKG